MRYKNRLCASSGVNYGLLLLGELGIELPTAGAQNDDHDDDDDDADEPPDRRVAFLGSRVACV